MLIELISRETNVPVDSLYRIARTADHRYREYPIHKRRGGQRLIEHPSRELKFLQRWIAEKVFLRFPLHECATAYKPRSSIKDNAIRHTSGQYLLKMDFESFFHSITGEDIRRFLEKEAAGVGLQVDDEDIAFIAKVVSRRNRLVMGAPSSPIVSNTLLYSFDEMVFHKAEEYGITYSRYADDLTFSCNQPAVLQEWERWVARLVEDLGYPRLRIAQKKTVHTSKRYRRFVTGLILTSDGRVSIGRSRKRMIRALIHKMDFVDLPEDEVLYVYGMVNFAKDCEPGFVSSLYNKYGSERLERVLSKGKKLALERANARMRRLLI